MAEILHTCSLDEYLGVLFLIFENIRFWALGTKKNFWAEYRSSSVRRNNCFSVVEALSRVLAVKACMGAHSLIVELDYADRFSLVLTLRGVRYTVPVPTSLVGREFRKIHFAGFREGRGTV